MKLSTSCAVPEPKGARLPMRTGELKVEGLLKHRLKYRSQDRHLVQATYVRQLACARFGSLRRNATMV